MPPPPNASFSQEIRAKNSRPYYGIMLVKNPLKALLYLFFCVCLLVVKWHWETYIFKPFPFDFLSRLKLRFLQALKLRTSGFSTLPRLPPQQKDSESKWHQKLTFSIPKSTFKKKAKRTPSHPNTHKKKKQLVFVWYIIFFWIFEGDVLPFLP